MSEFSNLETAVERGNLKLINVVALPRSLSTALGRALSQGEDPKIFINEPFNRNNFDLEVAAHSLLRYTAPPLRSADDRLTIITKNMAAYLSTEIFQKLFDISDATIWSIRNPLTQMGSFLTRIANDLAPEDEAEITQDSLSPHLDAVTSFLENGTLSNDFSRTGWKSIGTLFRGVDPHEGIVVDGEQLALDPVSTLAKVCKFARLEFSPSMVGDWRNGYININVNSSKFDTKANPWTSHVATSTGIESTSREPLNLDKLPASLREHIVNVAIPTYEAMIKAA